MDAALLADLPLASRLAVAYAPRAQRLMALHVASLDARLARIVASVNEPLLAQMRLAWWRDNLRLPAAKRPKGDPLLDGIGATFPDAAPLVSLVDGYEALLAEPPLTETILSAFIAGRAAAWASLCPSSTDAAEQAVALWSLDEVELQGIAVEPVTVLRGQYPQRAPNLPRELRPLAVLSGLAARARAKDERNLIGSRGSVLAALRLGFTGR